MYVKRPEGDDTVWEAYIAGNNIDGYRLLADVIVLKAVADYRENAARLKKFPKNRHLQREQKKLKAFFCSDWFQTLCPLDGRALLARLQSE